MFLLWTFKFQSCGSSWKGPAVRDSQWWPFFIAAEWGRVVPLFWALSGGKTLTLLPLFPDNSLPSGQSPSWCFSGSICSSIVSISDLLDCPEGLGMEKAKFALCSVVLWQMNKAVRCLSPRGWCLTRASKQHTDDIQNQDVFGWEAALLGKICWTA